jgi:hypothetical protein
MRTLTDLADVAVTKETVIAAISGMAGTGKTALAVHWAHQVAQCFPDGQLAVNLRGFDPSGTPMTAAEAIRACLDSLGVTAAQLPVGLAAQVALYRSLLAGKRLLVLLDNARDVPQPVISSSRATAVVVITSRTQLTGLAATDGAHLLTLGPLSRAETTELLGTSSRASPDGCRAGSHRRAHHTVCRTCPGGKHPRRSRRQHGLFADRVRRAAARRTRAAGRHGNR